MDILHITELSVMAQIGVHAWEQKILQPLLLDIHIPLEVCKCENKLENTLDYEMLCQYITNFIASSSFTLIETVAEAVVNLIKTEFKIDKVTLTVKKPHAIKNAKMVAITIDR